LSEQVCCDVNGVVYLFRCPKCSRVHSEEEYRERRFCRKCGTYLSVKGKIWKDESSQEEIGKGTAEDIFPYDPYPEQLAFMKDIEQVVSSGGVLVAEACNGFGKTVCALSALLPLDSQVIYATRTHEQARQVLEEMERINGKSRKDFSAVNLASRNHLCLDKRCNTLSTGEGLEACRILREEEKCGYKWQLDDVSVTLPAVLSINELRKRGYEEKVCPYFLARKVSETSRVVVSPYQYVFDPAIRERANLQLGGKVLVFDEAHNAEAIGLDVLSDTLSDRAVRSARQELHEIKKSPRFLDGLEAYLDEKVPNEGAVARSGAALHQDLEGVFGRISISSLIASASELVELIRKKRMEQGQYPVCYLNGVLRFLSLVESGPRECYLAVYRTTNQGLRMVEYRCLDPSLAIKPVIKEVNGTLIMSGTLAPMDLYTEILGIRNAEIRTYSAIARPENVHLLIDPSVTTRFSERGETMMIRYGEKMTRAIGSIPHGVLVFFPQRRLMLKALSDWRRNAVAEGTDSSMVLGGKKLFVEGIDAEENRRVVEEYKKEAEGEGAVLCCVFRGRNAEGSNFPDEQARGVILVGVPYADISDPIVKARMEYLNRKEKGLGEKWYLMDAFKAVNQAIGRGIRHRDDWCHFILMDQRYKAKLSLLSSWVLAGDVRETTPGELAVSYEDSTQAHDVAYHKLSQNNTL
jgi:Rad3-related DNA helicase